MFVKTKIYSVYVKKDVTNPLKNAVLVKQGFNFWAFVFNIIWSLYHRLWLVSIVLLLVAGLFSLSESPSMAIASVLFNLWFGFEANGFKAAKLERKGYILFDIVTGIDKIAAEQRFYDKYFIVKDASLKKGTFAFSN